MVKVELIFVFNDDTHEEILSAMENMPERGDIFHWQGERWQVTDVEEFDDLNTTAWLEPATDKSEYLPTP